MTPKLTVAVLTYNGERLLPECLRSILTQDIPVSHEILVVDNGSARPVTPSELDKRVRLVCLDPNRGNIGGMNACFEHARGEYVLFVANDVRLWPYAIQTLWADFMAHAGCGVLQPTLYQPNGELDNAGLRWRWPGYGLRIRYIDTIGIGGCPINTPLEVPSFAATCFLMRKDVFRLVGGFDVFLGISHEDIDLSLRIRKAGYTCNVSRHAGATHLMGQTIGRTVTNLSSYYHVSRLRTIAKHYAGVDRAARTCAVRLLDGLSSLMRGR